ncbi:3-carboxy-cis,cis-muconate cycloisomerase [Allorhizobium pseudoryzae]|uniref:3-carboxy-cis,cis-muconate cycloisomerase n=1 Tax=Allorhizobium pseudoryzae TaxID=379684 RepID=UPI003D025717
MTISAFEHPYLSGLLGDEETGALFAAQADIRAMLSFERALALAEAEEGVIPSAAANRIAEVCHSFRPDIPGLRQGVAKDGIVAAELVKQLRAAVGGEEAQFVHYGATSQDVIDTSLMLRMKGALALFLARLSELQSEFDRLQQTFGPRVLMGHTRMQAAIPMTATDRLTSWSAPLERDQQRLKALTDDGLPVQFGGAAGTLDKLPEKGAAVRARLAAHLGLADAVQWHSQRDRIVAIADVLSMISGSLGKIGQDVALLAQMAGEIRLSGGGGSSAMAHKQNPVVAEALVSLARFNAVQVSGMHQSLVHEQERSGAAWTLEWMLLPGITMATGASLRLSHDLLSKIQSLGRDPE